jgi:thioredoxin 1
MKAIKFSASWCGPCKMLATVVAKAGDKITVPIESVDIDENQEMAVKYGVRGVPTMVIVDGTGKEITRKVGMMNETQLLEFLKG